MDYKKEVQSLIENEQKDWFKPEAGKQTITILSEPEEIEKTFEGEIRKQIRLTINHNNKKYTWDVGRGETRASLYGQLILLGNMKGKLKDITFHLNVIPDGKKNKYFIDEVLPFLKPSEEKK